MTSLFFNACISPYLKGHPHRSIMPFKGIRYTYLAVFLLLVFCWSPVHQPVQVASAGPILGGTAAGLCWHNYRRMFASEMLNLAGHGAFVPWAVPTVAGGASLRLISAFLACEALAAAAAAAPTP